MSYLRKEDREDLIEILEDRLEKNVKITLFIKEDCPACDTALELLEEVQSLNEKIELAIRDMDKEPSQVERAPAIELAKNIKIYAIPIMNEFPSLIEGIILVSSGRSNLDDYIIEDLKRIKESRIKVFVTPYCPVCPDAVNLVEEFAIENDAISVEIISLEEFPEFIDEYKIKGTPTIIVNEDRRIDAEVPDDSCLEFISFPINYFILPF
jgi:glutaredoxin-like protein